MRLKVQPAGGTFDDDKFTAKVVFTLSADNPNAELAERAAFAKYCGFYGLKPEHYGTKIQTRQCGEITLVGFEPTRSRFSIRARDSEGKIRVFTDDLVKRLAQHDHAAA